MATSPSSWQTGRWLDESSNQAPIVTAVAREREQDAIESESKSTTSRDDVFPYTTLLLLWLLHIVYYYQWKRQRRKSTTISHRDIVIRRRYHKLWLALLSTFGAEDSPRQASTFDVVSNDVSSLTIPMGNSAENQARYSFLSDNYQRRFTNVTNTCSRFYSSIGGKAALRLIYFSHLIWSCRALETHFGSSIRYLAKILSCVCWNIGLETWLCHRAAQLLPGSRHRIQAGELPISPMLLCMIPIMTFHTAFPHTVIPAIPFYYFPHSNTIGGYISLLLPLGYLSKEVSIVCRVGLFCYIWVRIGMPNFELFGLLGLVFMCHHWLEEVGWDRRTGRMLIYDEEMRQWSDYEPYMDTEETGSHSISETDSNSDEIEENSIATGSSEENIDQRDLDVTDDERSPLTQNATVWRNEMRSRRVVLQSTD